jgi:ribosomal protein L11 methyltransferase
MPWSVVEIPLDEGISEVAGERLRATGADGVAEEWRKGQNYLRGFWKDADERHVSLVTEQMLRGLVELGLLSAAPAFSVTSMEDQDWLEGWKQYFTPLAVSPQLAIVPSWEQYTPTPGQAIITLDPGMAFGTGTHGTTYTCLQAISAYLQPGGQRVLDVGTGSGILAIAAVKLGAGTVVATDNDDLAVRVARDNAAVNGVAEAIDFRVTDLLQGIDAQFDLVIANILAPVILQLIPDLPRVLSPRALFISSGYITSQEDEIRNALRAAGHIVLARYAREDWVTLVTRG